MPKSNEYSDGRRQQVAKNETIGRSQQDQLHHPAPSPALGASTAAAASALTGTAMRAPTEEEEFNSRRRHMSLDEACHSSKRERALYGSRPL
jgi:hypothetical protein